MEIVIIIQADLRDIPCGSIGTRYSIPCANISTLEPIRVGPVASICIVIDVYQGLTLGLGHFGDVGAGEGRATAAVLHGWSCCSFNIVTADEIEKIYAHA
jgi:hypothetical protein